MECFLNPLLYVTVLFLFMPTPTGQPSLLRPLSSTRHQGVFSFGPLSLNPAHGCVKIPVYQPAVARSSRHVWHQQPSQRFKVPSASFLPHSIARTICQRAILDDKVAGDWTAACSTHTLQSQLGLKQKSVGYQAAASLLVQRSFFHLTITSNWDALMRSRLGLRTIISLSLREADWL